MKYYKIKKFYYKTPLRLSVYFFLLLFLSLFFNDSHPISKALADDEEANVTKKINKIVSWPDRKYEWYFSSKNAAGWMNDEDAIRLFKKAADTWQACGVGIAYKGLTDSPTAAKDRVSVIGWAHLPPRIRGLTFRNVRHSSDALLEADIVFNIDNRDIFMDPNLLFKVVLHEMGHALGLVHAETCNEVMSSAAECGKNIANPPPLSPTAKDLEQCALRYPKD